MIEAQLSLQLLGLIAVAGVAALHQKRADLPFEVIECCWRQRRIIDLRSDSRWLQGDDHQPQAQDRKESIFDDEIHRSTPLPRREFHPPMLAFSVLLNHLPEELLPRLQERAQSQQIDGISIE